MQLDKETYREMKMKLQNHMTQYGMECSKIKKFILQCKKTM
jgi:hypothetical protein